MQRLLSKELRSKCCESLELFILRFRFALVLLIMVQTKERERRTAQDEKDARQEESRQEMDRQQGRVI